MGKLTDAYAVLGVGPDASQAEVEAAYKARLTLLHPDRLAGRSTREREAAAAMLAQLQDAWAAVGTERARARYDAERERADAARPEPGPGTTWDATTAASSGPSPVWERVGDAQAATRSATVPRRRARRRLPWWLWPARAVNAAARGVAGGLPGLGAWVVGWPLLGVGWLVFSLVAEGIGLGANGLVPFFAGVAAAGFWLLVGVHRAWLSAQGR